MTALCVSEMLLRFILTEIYQVLPLFVTGECVIYSSFVLSVVTLKSMLALVSANAVIVMHITARQSTRAMIFFIQKIFLSLCRTCVYKIGLMCYHLRDLAELHIIADVRFPACYARFLLADSGASQLCSPMESPPFQLMGASGLFTMKRVTPTIRRHVIAPHAKSVKLIDISKPSLYWFDWRIQECFLFDP